jgi:parallel beta-helix repeat protein
MKKTAAVTLILISLMALGVVCVRPIKAQYQGGFTINADGSVTPSTAPIQRVGDTYILTSNVVGTIAVQRNCTVFDGNGYMLSGGQFQLFYVENVTLKNLIVMQQAIGIFLCYASNVTVANNTITETGVPVPGLQETGGIFVEDASSNIIAGNNLVNNQVAILLGAAYQNVIVENNITGSSVAGITFWSASNNIIYHNNFINNVVQAQEPGVGYFLNYQAYSVNIWDDGYPSGGNHWSDYLTRYPGATEIDGSGIGDTPYVLLNSTDRYPLMKPFNSTLYLLETTPPKISFLSPLNQTYNETSVSLVFAVDKSVDWMGYSLDGEQNVTLTGNSTVAGMLNGLHSIIVYANDTFGNTGASETFSFTVAKPEPFPFVPVAAASVAVGLIAAGFLVYFKKHRRGAGQTVPGKLLTEVVRRLARNLTWP